MAQVKSPRKGWRERKHLGPRASAGEGSKQEDRRRSWAEDKAGQGAAGGQREFRDGARVSHGAPPHRIHWERLVETPFKPSHNNLFLDQLSPQRALLCYLLDKCIHTLTLGACNIRNPQLKTHNLTLTPPHGGIHRIKHLISSEWGPQAHRHPHTVKALLKSHTGGGESYLWGDGAPKEGAGAEKALFLGPTRLPSPHLETCPAFLPW